MLSALSCALSATPLSLEIQQALANARASSVLAVAAAHRQSLSRGSPLAPSPPVPIAMASSSFPAAGHATREAPALRPTAFRTDNDRHDVPGASGSGYSERAGARGEEFDAEELGDASSDLGGASLTSGDDMEAGGDRAMDDSPDHEGDGEELGGEENGGDDDEEDGDTCMQDGPPHVHQNR